MKMRLIIVVVFLIAMTAGVADAEWTVEEMGKAKPQPFQIKDDTKSSLMFFDKDGEVMWSAP